MLLKKKIPAILLAIFLVIAIMPTTTDVAYAATNPDVYHNVTQENAEIQLGDTFSFDLTVIRAANNKEKLYCNIYYGKTTNNNSPYYEYNISYANQSALTIEQHLNWDTTDIAPGTYTIEYYLEHYTSGYKATTTKKTFNVTVVSSEYGSFAPSETGLTISKAFTVEYDTTYAIMWTKANYNNKALHKVVVPKQSEITFKITKPQDSSGEYKPVKLFVYDSSGEMIADAYVGYRDTSIFDYYTYNIFLDQGTYYFDIQPFFGVSGGAVKCDYSFSRRDAVYSETEYNNSTTTADTLTAGEMHEGYLGNDYGTNIKTDDYFKFDVASGKDLTIKLGNFAKIKQTTALLSIEMPDGSEKSLIYYMKPNSNDVGIYTFNAETSGTYYVHFYNYSGKGIYYNIGFTTSNHKYQTDDVTPATLSSNGYIYKECVNCGKETKTTIYYPKTIKLSATSYTYDGKVKKPTVTVKDSKGKTIDASNYKVTYASGRKNVGSYKVTVKFKGNYSGTKTLTFKINPKGTTLKTLTATSKGFKATWTKQATKMSTSYITGYQIQYSTSSTFASGNKTITVDKYTTVSKAVSKLTAKKKYYVRIRTYKTVSGVKYYSPWSKSKYVTTKA